MIINSSSYVQTIRLQHMTDRRKKVMFLSFLKNILRASSPGRCGGGAGKGRRACNCLWNLNICIEKVHAKCWWAEMILAMTSLPLARIFQCFFTFALVSASRWVAEIWQLSRRGVTGKVEVEFKFKLRALIPFPALPPDRPGELARRLLKKGPKSYETQGGWVKMKVFLE